MSKKQNPLGKVIAKALQDEAFKQQLITDPAAVLKVEDIEIPAGLTVKVVADTESVRHIVLPALSGKLSDEEISQVSAAGWACAQCDSKTKCLIRQDTGIL